MPIKLGVPLDQAGLLDVSQLRIAKALSVTTVEELAGILLTAGQRVGPLFEGADLPQLAAEAMKMASYSVTDDLKRAREASGDRGTGALPPTESDAERVSELFVEDVDLRLGDASDKPEVFLESCLGPVRDQGQRGTCVAHAVVAVLECLEAHRLGTKIDLSEQFLYWACKMKDRAPHQSGTWQQVAVPLAVESGICKEHIWPYNPTTIARNESHGPPPDQSAAASDASEHMPKQGLIMNGSALDRVMARLDDGHCLAISVPVYSNWETPTVEHEGHIPMPIPGEVPKGGHAMCVVGYGYSDDEFTGGGYVIVRNSWGTSWAYRSPFGPGYGTLPFSYVSRYWWELTSLD
ncbi:C1 family peptidase [Mycolicibacterium sp.]|uniref:C1 family peptidase n=1 Tax=Mycolicibacterium sp. TaxID=2320850 RepID=UPI003D121422